MTARLRALVCVAVLVAARAASAQETPPEGEPGTEAAPSPEAVEQAKQHYEAGKAFHDVGEYAKAADEYGQAYELVKMPVLLYNIAQVKRLGGEKQSALEYYEKYLAMDPGGPGADNAREMSEELRKELAAGEKPVDYHAPDDNSHDAAPIDLQLPSKPVQYARDENAGRGKRMAGLIAGGVGVVSLAVAVKFGLDARALSDDASGVSGVWDPADEMIWDDGKTAERRTIIFSAIGAAAITTGTALYILGAREAAPDSLRERSGGRERRVIVAPTASPTGAGAALRLDF